MAIVNQVQKKIRMDQWDIVKFQLTVYCYLKRIPISELDLNCLTLLGITGEKELGEFCDLARAQKIFGSTQSVRNALAKAERKSLIVKNGKNKKKISLKDDMKIQAKGNILLDYKILRVDSEESTGTK